MALIEFIDNENEIKGILTDGYFPDFSSLQQMDWEKAKEDMLPDDDKLRRIFQRKYERHLSPEKDIPTERVQAKYFKDLMALVRLGFCPYNIEPCVKFYNPARIKGAKHVERVVSFFDKRTRDKILPAFSKEIDKDISEGIKNYFFNSAFLDLKTENFCHDFEECTNNWIDFFGFKIKDEKDYWDFQAYKEAAETFLKAYINFGVEKMDWFNRRERSNYIR